MDRHEVRFQRRYRGSRRIVTGPCVPRTRPRRLCRAQSVDKSPGLTITVFGRHRVEDEKTMTSKYLGPYRLSAYNTAHDSDNKIHDDAVARRFGFDGGLVPGVDVYGYMTHLPVMRWGRAWLERGTAS